MQVLLDSLTPIMLMQAGNQLYQSVSAKDLQSEWKITWILEKSVAF